MSVPGEAGEAENPRTSLGAELLGSRRVCLALAAAGAVHVALAQAGLGGWPCPLLAATGIPCPGCGLGRACGLLLVGKVGAALQTHAFAPAALVAIGLLAVAGFAPESVSARLRAGLGRVERAIPVVPLLLVGVIFYWVARFWLDALPVVR